MFTIQPTPKQVGEYLAQHPRPFMLLSTVDGIEYGFADDGGTIAEVKMPGGAVRYQMNPNSRRQDTLNAAGKRRTDKGFEGLPTFVSKTSIEPAFEGDSCCTTDRGGVIALLSKELEKAVKASQAARADRAKADVARGMAEAAAFSSFKAGKPAPGADAAVASQLVSLQADLAAFKASTSAELESVRAENARLAEENAALKGAEGGGSSKKG